ncbi:hypothetical protein BDQ94DRAFT_155364 [Aspergillus welwitschiae]|uniref:Uncharacterized protein n=1 Tax=Aspergillus welwitschiae TaxID=1341132 RepID=A0A3F3PHW5_9EURO|nr:hypothetical protein BDQ94DRAFT_155364 [Aspergillus welwitschiae]RDH26545.1 hypothetical protein BDQ94DRAFT_155364 [Aspergillus welwitschiae]
MKRNRIKSVSECCIIGRRSRHNPTTFERPVEINTRETRTKQLNQQGQWWIAIDANKWRIGKGSAPG